MGSTYACKHPLYRYCTLYSKGDIGLAVVQQRYDPKSRHTWWGPIDVKLVNDIYYQELFEKVFTQRAGKSVDGIFPTISIRKLMYALRMKPLQKELWEIDI